MSEPKIGEWRAFEWEQGISVGYIHQLESSDAFFIVSPGGCIDCAKVTKWGPPLDPLTLLDFTPHTPEPVAFGDEKTRSCLGCAHFKNIMSERIELIAYCGKRVWYRSESPITNMRRAATCGHFEKLEETK